MNKTLNFLLVAGVVGASLVTINSAAASESNNFCRSQINAAISALQSHGFKVLSSSITQIKGYHNVPQGFSKKVVFIVDRLVPNPTAYQTAAKQLQGCPALGLINFGEPNSSFIASLGMIEGRMRPFKPSGNATIHNGKFTLPWGYEPSL